MITAEINTTIYHKLVENIIKRKQYNVNYETIILLHADVVYFTVHTYVIPTWHEF